MHTNPGSRLVLQTILLFNLGILLVACSPEQPTTPPVINPPAGEGVPVQITLLATKDLMSPEVISLFGDMLDSSVIENTYDHDQELISKVQDNPGAYGVIIASNHAASVLLEFGLLAEMDVNNVPNLGNIDLRFRNLIYDRSNQYCAPFLWGGVGIGYVNGQIPTPTSWREIVQPAGGSPTYGRISLLDDAREGLGAALLALGYDLNATTEAEIVAAKNLLLESSSGIADINNQAYRDSLAFGDFLLVQGWNKDLLFAQENNPEINIVFPQEGGILRIYSMCIPSTVTPGQKLMAEAFINFALQADSAAHNVFWSQHASTVSTANDNISASTLQNPLIYIPDEFFNRMQYIYSVGPLEIVYENFWDEVKAAIP